MTASITIFPGITTLDIPVGRVLDGALEASLDSVLVIGMKDGKVVAYSNTSDIGSRLLMLEITKRMLLDAAIEES